MSSTGEKPTPPHYDLTRMQSLSDGIFSITLVLLVFGLDVPAPDELLPLADTLQHFSPELIGYFIGAMYVGVVWLMHHHLLHTFSYTDTIFIALNFIFLTSIMLVPYFLGLAMVYLNTPDARTAAVMYSSSALFTIIMLQILLRYSDYAHLMDKKTPKTEKTTLYSTFNLASVVYIVTVIISFITPGWMMAAHFIAILSLIGRIVWQAQHNLRASSANV